MAFIASLLNLATLLAAAQEAWAMAERPKETAPAVEQSLALSATEAYAEIKKYQPRDCIAYIYREGDKLGAVFHRRIEFYTLPKDVYALCGGTSMEGECGSWGTLAFVQGKAPKFGKGGAALGKDRRSVNLFPDKVLSFRHTVRGIGISEIIYGKGPNFRCGYFLVTTSMENPERYDYCDAEERILLERWAKAIYGKGVYRLRVKEDKKAEYGEFYGMFSVDGKLVFQLQLPVVPSGNFCVPLLMEGDGSRAYFAVVRWVQSRSGHRTLLGDMSEVIEWTPAGGVRRMTVAEANADSFLSTKPGARFYQFKGEDLTDE